MTRNVYQTVLQINVVNIILDFMLHIKALAYLSAQRFEVSGADSTEKNLLFCKDIRMHRYYLGLRLKGC